MSVKTTRRGKLRFSGTWWTFAGSLYVRCSDSSRIYPGTPSASWKSSRASSCLSVTGRARSRAKWSVYSDTSLRSPVSHRQRVRKSTLYNFLSLVWCGPCETCNSLRSTWSWMCGRGIQNRQFEVTWGGRIEECQFIVKRWITSMRPFLMAAYDLPFCRFQWLFAK